MNTAELLTYAQQHLQRLFTPVQPHPETGRIEAELQQWARESGLLRDEASVTRFQRRRIGTMAGYCMPEASADIVSVTACYLAWIFVFDDEVAEDPVSLETYRAADLPAALCSGWRQPGRNEFADSLIRIRREITALGGSELLPELSRGLEMYLAACAREAPWRRHGRTPSLPGYLDDRIATSGGHALHLHRLDSGMPEPGSHLPASVESLADLAFLIGGLANDLAGFPHEYHNADPVNVITVLRCEYGRSTEESFREAVTLHAGYKHWFDRTSNRLLSAAHGNPASENLIRAITGWVAGSGAAMARYLQP